MLIIELEGLDVRQADVRMYVSHLVSSQTLSIHVRSRLHEERDMLINHSLSHLCVYMASCIASKYSVQSKLYLCCKSE